MVTEVSDIVNLLEAARFVSPATKASEHAENYLPLRSHLTSNEELIKTYFCNDNCFLLACISVSFALISVNPGNVMPDRWSVTINAQPAEETAYEFGEVTDAEGYGSVVAGFDGAYTVQRALHRAAYTF